MNLQHPTLLALALALALASSLAGCGAAPPPPAEARVHEVSRDVALNTARRDAAGLGISITDVNVQRAGAHWVIELRARNGSGMRYAISRVDGSIRQRSVFQ